MNKQEVIGFIGLGVMGKPMAGHVIAAGYEVRLYSRSGVPEHLLQAGGVECTSPAHAASDADYVITMLPDTADVQRVLLGERGVLETLKSGAVMIDMSSITPSATVDLAAKVRGVGADYLDAPVSGGDIGAQNASLTIMVGGEQATFHRALPLLSLMGGSVTLIGEVGAGQVCKLANQIVGAQTIQAIAEGLLFATRMGVDPARVRTALMGGFAQSRVLEVHGNRMLQRDFQPGFTTALHRKDMKNVLKSADELGLNLPNAAATTAMLLAAEDMGLGGEDSSALIKVLEKMNPSK